MLSKTCPDQGSLNSRRCVVTLGVFRLNLLDVARELLIGLSLGDFTCINLCGQGKPHAVALGADGWEGSANFSIIDTGDALHLCAKRLSLAGGELLLVLLSRTACCQNWHA